ncbi:hypothetical protein [Roseateles chitinivorans]|uniref:hypothetical protein n=1 Tax=Roseateles chitinivorans TaxID=2917965 RepID=UPI003D669D22
MPPLSPPSPPARKSLGSEADAILIQLERWGYLQAFVLESHLLFERCEAKASQPKTPGIEGISEAFAVSACFKAAVLAYAKCFSEAKGRTKLNHLKVFPDGHPLRDTHATLMDWRNMYVAHNEGLDQISLTVDDRHDRLVYAGRYQFQLPTQSFDSFRAALQCVEVYVLEKVTAFEQQLSSAIGKPVECANQSLAQLTRN